jgi:hypothetical protein
MNVHLKRAAAGFTFAFIAACATAPSGGGSSTNWVICETSSDCDPGHPCVDHHCQGQTASSASYSLEVVVMLSFADENAGMAIGWVGEPPVPAARSLHLTKAFESAEAARAFEGTFVVYRAGTEVGRETIRFADCDPIADLGVDPQLVRSVVISRSWTGGTLSLDTHSNDIAPYGCFLSPVPVPAVLTGPKRLLFQIPSNERLTFTYAGENLMPRDIQLFPQTKLWQVLVHSKDTGGSGLGELGVSSGGQSVGSVPVSFDQCAVSSGKTVVEKQLLLTLSVDGGLSSVAVDPYGGVTCLYSDGTASSAIP